MRGWHKDGCVSHHIVIASGDRGDGTRMGAQRQVGQMAQEQPGEGMAQGQVHKDGWFRQCKNKCMRTVQTDSTRESGQVGEMARLGEGML